MKKEDLEALGLSTEQIAGIQKLNGIDISKEQNVAKGYKTQLDDVQKKLKEFDGINIEELQGKITTLTNDLNKTKTSYESQIEDLRFNSAIESKVSSYNPRNAKAVMALLDIDALKKSKNQDTDISAALEKVKKENDYLFGTAETSGVGIKRVVSGTDTTHTDSSDKKAAANEAFRALLKNE